MKTSVWDWMLVVCVALATAECAGNGNGGSSARAEGGAASESSAHSEQAGSPQAGQTVPKDGDPAADTSNGAAGRNAADNTASRGREAGAGGASGGEGGAATNAGRAGAGGSGVVSGGTGGRITTGKGGSARDAGEDAAMVAPGESKGLTVYLVRHAETLANIFDSGVSPQEGVEEFTPLGLRQITLLTDYLVESEITPDVVLVSPTSRTQKTIEPFLIAKGLSAEIWMEIDECYYTTPTGGDLPTQPKYNRFLKATLLSDRFAFRDPKANVPWQIGTYEDGLFMAMTARDLFLARYGQSGKTIMIVGHMGTGTMLLGLLLGHDMKDGQDALGKRFFLWNTGVQKLSQDPTTGTFTLEGTNINKPPMK